MTKVAEREVWADTAKALSIMLVVIAHASGFMAVTGIAAPDVVETAWRTVLTAITPVRVPLFFVISGFFAVRAINGTWRRVLSTRVANSLWVYVVWLLVLIMIFGTLLPAPSGIDYTLPGLPAQLVTPVNHIWYLWALAVYVIIARAFRSYPWPALAIALLLNLVSAAPWQPMPDNIVRGLFFFLLGAYAPQALRYLSAQFRPYLFAGTVIGYAGMAFIVRRFELGEVPAAITLMSILGVAMVVQAVLIVVRIRAVARLGSYVGRRTLPIYVMHFPLLATLALGLAAIAPALPASLATLLLVTFPLVASAVVAAVALGIYAALNRGAGRYLFTAPRKRAHESQRAAAKV